MCSLYPNLSEIWMIMMMAIRAPWSECLHLMNLREVKCAFMHRFIYICVRINGHDVGQAVQADINSSKTKKRGGLSFVRHSGPTVMMNADQIYGGDKECELGRKWVWGCNNEAERGGEEEMNEKFEIMKVEVGCCWRCTEAVYLQLRYRHLSPRDVWCFQGVGERLDVRAVVSKVSLGDKHGKILGLGDMA